MLKVYIIRHAQSANNALADQGQRVADPQLTELGVQQAQYLAQHLKTGDSRDMDVDYRSGYSERRGVRSFGFTHLYCSAMHRALQTALPVAQAVGLMPEIWLELHEVGGIYLDNGNGREGLPGKTRLEVVREFAGFGIPEAFAPDGWWGAARGYEAQDMALARVQSVAQKLRERALTDDTIGLITHGTFSDRLLKVLLGQNDMRGFYYMLYNASITRLDFLDEARILVRYINRIDHLPEDMVS
ncbi:MAG: phosphoglycerate mutase family protein [Anaerolineae bacterium]|nr:phosphoglycerate mutase family protein [Anaerolineae bacterium]